MIYLKRKVIVHLSSVHYPFDTRIFVKECRSLVEHGFEVELLAQFDGHRKIDGIFVNGLPKAEKKLDRLTKVIPALIRKALTYPRGTIFHFHDSELIVICFFLKFIGYRIVYDIHEHTPKSLLSKEWLPMYLRKPIAWIVQILEYLAGLFFDGIVTVVPPVSERFKHANQVEVSNYPKLDNSYNSYLVDIPIYEKKNEAIYIGSITTVRGAKIMVEAAALVDPKYNFKLNLGGRYQPDSLREELLRIPGWQWVRELGWLSISEIWNHLSYVKIGLVVLQPTPAHLVLESVKMFEYMAAGLPVIASDFPLYRDIVKKEQCGILVDPTKPIEISKAIEWMLNNPEEIEEMGKRGKQAVLRKYNWETEEQKLVNFYEQIFSRLVKNSNSLHDQI